MEKKTKQFNLRIEPSIIEKLTKIAEKESDKSGFKISMASMAVKILTDYIKKYKL